MTQAHGAEAVPSTPWVLDPSGPADPPADLHNHAQGPGIDLPHQAVTLMATLETAAPDLTRGERAVLQELLERLARGRRG
ncbi:hypothetical protein J4H86_17855 [Spiractinospora alimapuensis]|uniref:hypothetical protein n=1 Tax=Spiractinospora alimapuensis TaxID=2820884 RepID=UPI001F3DE9E0|nr:hypothetical protein [Spiractinospora alimapuensis]QVQ50734.1 hypothetical protein J4H86_17855 [Spiractinospora alimapuensis]